MSTPAEKALPSPLMTMAVTCDCDSIWARTWVNSSIIGISMTFSGGFRRVRRATASSITSEVRVSFESAATVIIASHIDGRFADFTDRSKRIAGACFFGDPFLLGFDNFEQ